MNLRQRIRKQRKQLSAKAVLAASVSITQKIIALLEFKNSQHIAAYFSNENEIDPAEIVRYAKAQHKKIYFPVLKNKNLVFYRVDQQTQYEKNLFGIPEPAHDKQDLFPTEKIDLFLVPLVAFDAHCHRIGRGAGYYDRALKNRNKKAVLIGLAYEFQKVDQIIPESWDVAMDMIVTEAGFY